MEIGIEIINSYSAYLLIGLVLAVIFLCIAFIIVSIKLNGLKKRYNFFMGVNRRPDMNLEDRLRQYADDVKAVKEKYDELLEKVIDVDNNLDYCTQKIGIVRYNPFDEMGGNLCFAVAILDGKDNGVVLNGIHSRSGSFTYAKPIEMGVSPYVLSIEELEALNKAKENGYNPKVEKIIKVKKVKTYTISIEENKKIIDNLNIKKESKKIKKLKEELAGENKEEKVESINEKPNIISIKNTVLEEEITENTKHTIVQEKSIEDVENTMEKEENNLEAKKDLKELDIEEKERDISKRKKELNILCREKLKLNLEPDTTEIIGRRKRMKEKKKKETLENEFVIKDKIESEYKLLENNDIENQLIQKEDKDKEKKNMQGTLIQNNANEMVKEQIEMKR